MSTVPAINPFRPTQAISGTSSGTAARSGGVSVGVPSQNPFAMSEDCGVGLVKSNLNNLSYTLPNGKTSNCNTICIC